jgi:hypothetical protein
MTRRAPAPRSAALLAFFAILFQAVLFGWHHHEPILAGHLPATIVESNTASAQTLDDEDGCEICQALHHLFAAPVDVAAPLPPHAIAADRLGGEPAPAARSFVLGFRARAPPLA